MQNPIKIKEKLKVKYAFKLFKKHAYISKNMKILFDGSVILATVILITLAYNSNFLSYHNCMSQTKLDYITEKGAAHVAAQCRTFILEKAMTN